MDGSAYNDELEVLLQDGVRVKVLEVTEEDDQTPVNKENGKGVTEKNDNELKKITIITWTTW